jgi:tetratricopeptide (TPR) repeat protein
MGFKDISKCLLSLLFMLWAYYGIAQVHAPEIVPVKWLFIAEQQFEEGQYALGIQSASTYISAVSGITDLKTTNEIEKARYIIAVSRLKTNVVSGITDAQQLMAATPVAAYKQRTAYALAQYHFRHNQFNKAIPYYETAGIANLSNEEIANEKFELAYCYFNNRQLDQAEPLFASIKELQKGKYFAAGNYYYGLLAYNANNYHEALTSFERIKDLPQYSNIVPYYIAEIYYFTGDRTKALQEAETLVKRTDKIYYDNELHLLAAQCLFEEQHFKDALPYFEFYYDNVEKIRKEDLYEMAYCYYRVSNWTQAIDKFKLLSSTNDSLGQTAMYLLGDAYLQTGDKTSARNAFSFCGDMNFNQTLQETAVLLYAKLSYELGYNDDAITALKSLLEHFKDNRDKDEARTLLSDVLLKTSNYYEAYTYLTEVKEKNEEYWYVYQKVAYGYALQQAGLGNTILADSLLTITLQHPKDNNYKAATFFWIGELAYRQNKFEQTIHFSQDFLNTSESNNDVKKISAVATRQHALLNMGYAAMAENKYTDARKYFNDAQQNTGTGIIENQEALLHEADAVFMSKDYPHAVVLYDKIIAGNGSDADYARYQKSILLGLQGQPGAKVALLQQLIDKGPLSTMAVAARYELAITYIETNKYKEAIGLLQPLTISTAAGVAPKALLKTAFAYQQMNDAPAAVAAYKHIITDFSSSEERTAALDALKSLYIENDEPAEYAKFLKENNLSSTDNNTLDSAYYKAAEVQFASGNWDKARDAMGKYLSQYPNGMFVTRAHYYRAESDYLLKDNKDALIDYNTILQGQPNEYTENSAKRAAAIAYQAEDYKAAASHYQSLLTANNNNSNKQTAYIGLMKTNFHLNSNDISSAYADSILAMTGGDTAIRGEAQLYKGKNLLQLKKEEAAQPYFQQLQDNNNISVAAEARYNLATYAYDHNDLKEAEKQANATIKISAGNDYLIIRSYLLLADILVKEKDYFNARATLQSIVKNTRIPEMKQEAARKLEQVKTLEKKQSKLSGE